MEDTATTVQKLTKEKEVLEARLKAVKSLLGGYEGYAKSEELARANGLDLPGSTDKE